QPQGCGDRKIRTGGIPADGEPRWIDPIDRTLPAQPADRRKHLIERGGEFSFRREPVVDAHDDRTRSLRVLAHQPIVRVDTEHRPAAAMKIKHATERRRLHRYVETRSDAVDCGVHGAPHAGSAGSPGRAHLFRSLSTLCQWQRVEVGVLLIASLHCGHEATNLWIEPARIDPLYIAHARHL